MRQVSIYGHEKYTEEEWTEGLIQLLTPAKGRKAAEEIAKKAYMEPPSPATQNYMDTYGWSKMEAEYMGWVL